VRSAIFDRLQAEVRGARVLDLFAGTGALAIEAISRGAASATLVEQQGDVAAFARTQVQALGLSERARVICSDARRFLTSSASTLGEDEAAYDLVLVDPPYTEIELYGAVLEALVDARLLADSAVIVLEVQRLRGHRPDIPLPAEIVREAVRDHGQTSLEFLRYHAEPGQP
jgi:16S rRNA (guanine966-N2)-methyltransferase